jgi:hypothetical protein
MQNELKAKGVPNSEVGRIELKLKDFFRWQIFNDYSFCMDIPTERN